MQPSARSGPAAAVSEVIPAASAPSASGPSHISPRGPSGPATSRSGPSCLPPHPAPGPSGLGRHPTPGNPQRQPSRPGSSRADRSVLTRVCPPRAPVAGRHELICLLDRDRGPGALEGSLGLVRGLLVHVLEHRLRRAVDQVLGLLDALDLLVASSLENDVELVLLLGLFGGAGAGAGRGRTGHRDRGRGLDVEGILELLHELRELEQRHLLERVEQCVVAELRHSSSCSFLVPVACAIRMSLWPDRVCPVSVPGPSRRLRLRLRPRSGSPRHPQLRRRRPRSGPSRRRPARSALPPAPRAAWPSGPAAPRTWPQRWPSRPSWRRPAWPAIPLATPGRQA